MNDQEKTDVEKTKVMIIAGIMWLMFLYGVICGL